MNKLNNQQEYVMVKVCVNNVIQNVFVCVCVCMCVRKLTCVKTVFIIVPLLRV